ncbi:MULTISPECIES: 5'-methylthioadenosine/S-adenosylhomocysteine nucleosidase [Salimicrobium]|uniref:5'-methylthioadenosine/S-adenosylhomocysteine nucleosidase n=1 Tax=Salimicrobium humidisoli TaxID=2029857 RepID=A0ABX4HVU1_9BACI|nr:MULTISPECIES: 5'-methylthioadenosine/S-adenosylhomocysteine nucleosidase [Salimicrobium]PBB06820.1 5'-methylthioadenosine/S-adenosylhomocysteine nucleosidase [Salimicrobium humidisoli]
MSVGIIGAMDQEIKHLKEAMEVEEERTVAGQVFTKGQLNGKSVVLLLSGIGKVNAAMSTTILHEEFDIDYCINTGSAGGFDYELETGDIVISETVLHHDVDATAFDYVHGQVPGMPAVYPADKQLAFDALRQLKEMGLNGKLGVIASGDTFMQEEVRINEVRGRFPELIAVEMEAAAVAQVCYRYNTPFVVIRALSDVAGKESAVSFQKFLDQAAKNSTDLIKALI